MHFPFLQCDLTHSTYNRRSELHLTLGNIFCWGTQYIPLLYLTTGGACALSCPDLRLSGWT